MTPGISYRRSARALAPAINALRYFWAVMTGYGFSR